MKQALLHSELSSEVFRHEKLKLNKAFVNFEGVRLDTSIYYLAFGIYMFVYGLSKTYFVELLPIGMDIVIDIGRLVCVLLLLGKLFSQYYTIKQLFGIAIVGIVTVASLYVSKDWNLVLLFFFIVAGKDISIKKLAAIALPIQVILLLLTTIFANAGIIETRFIYRSVGGLLRLRSSLGYTHPNTFGNSVLSVCVSYAILRFPKFSPFDLMVYAIGILACSIFADSKSSVVCIGLIALFAFVACVLNGHKSFGKLAIFIAVLAFGTMAFSFYMMLFYDPSVQWMHNLDDIMSSRFSLAHAYYLDYPIRPFGRESGSVFMNFATYYTQHGPDNSYVRMLIIDGLFFTSIFYLLYLLALGGFARQQHADACIFGLGIFAVAAVMESYALSFATNYCLIGMTTLIYGWDCYRIANMPTSDIGVFYFSQEGSLIKVYEN